MCGIIAVVRRRSARTAPTTASLLALLDGAAGSLRSAPAGEVADVLVALADRVEAVDRLLRGTPGIAALLGDRTLGPAVDRACRYAA